MKKKDLKLYYSMITTTLSLLTYTHRKRETRVNVSKSK